MKKFPALVAVLSILMAQHATAETIVESDREFVWKEVPGTLAASKPVNNSAEELPWYVNAKKVIRQEGNVIFETVSPEAEYIRFRGNCKNNEILVQYIGKFESEKKVVYEPAPDFWSSWNKPNEIQQKLLNFVCTLELSN